MIDGEGKMKKGRQADVEQVVVSGVKGPMHSLKRVVNMDSCRFLPPRRGTV